MPILAVCQELPILSLMLSEIRTLLQRLGAVSPLALWAAYAGSITVLKMVAEILPPTPIGSTLLALLSLMLIGLLFTTVTWFRNDDWLAAGVLMSLVFYATFAIQALIFVLSEGGIGPAAIWSAVSAGGAILYAIIFAPLAGGLVALARWLTRASSRRIKN